MKKYLISLLIVISIMLLASVAAYATDVYIDGIKVNFNDSTGYPFTQNGRTFVPLRATMESFGATVDWEPDTQTGAGVHNVSKLK